MKTSVLLLFVVALLATFVPACSDDDTTPPIPVADVLRLSAKIRTIIKDETEEARPTLLTGKAWTNTTTQTIIKGSAVSTTQTETLDVIVSLTNLAITNEIWTVTGSCSYKCIKNIHNQEKTLTFNVLAKPLYLVSAATNRSLAFRNLVVDTRQNADTGELTTSISGGVSIDGFSYSYPRN